MFYGLRIMSQSFSKTVSLDCEPHRNVSGFSPPKLEQDSYSFLEFITRLPLEQLSSDNTPTASVWLTVFPDSRPR